MVIRVLINCSELSCICSVFVTFTICVSLFRHQNIILNIRTKRINYIPNNTKSEFHRIIDFCGRPVIRHHMSCVLLRPKPKINELYLAPNIQFSSQFNAFQRPFGTW